MTSLSPEAVLDSLRWRYATKVFDKERNIPSEAWSAIEDSLVLTPSSFGLQPWHFVVITDQSVKEQLLPHSWNQTQVTECSHFVVLAARQSAGDPEIQEWIDQLGKVRQVGADSLSGYQQMMSGFMGAMSQDQIQHWAKLQTYIALGQLMTTAAVTGIDACPMEGFNPAEYDRILDLPEKGYTASVACALGYRSPDDKYAELPKVRFEKEALLTRW
ncbi:MAG: NAD(P)H-dependent oxidoreductase [Verrucomicrobiaceae bacterium]